MKETVIKASIDYVVQVDDGLYFVDYGMFGTNLIELEKCDSFQTREKAKKAIEDEIKHCTGVKVQRGYRILRRITTVVLEEVDNAKYS